ncbi:uncharacterized protein ACB058_021583 [Synchiropus picturatus]
MEREGEAIRRYRESRPAVSVQACGLFVDWRRPWLAASPDGIVTDRRTGVRLRCLEVKCPFKHRRRRLEEACRDPGFCLEPTSDRSFRLKRSHGYFTQVQCQMAVTGLLAADFVVYTTRELAVVPVTFDPDFWAQTLPLLERFLPAGRGASPEPGGASGSHDSGAVCVCVNKSDLTWREAGHMTSGGC